MNSHFSRLAVSAALLIVCGLAQATSAAPSQKSEATKPKSGPAHFETDIAAFEAWDDKNATPDNPILFVGSSTIRLWQSANAFPGLPVINRGFGGSTIADVNHFADRIVFKYKPRLIVFYAGDNDIAGGRSPERVFSDFHTFANSVKERLPETRIIFLGVKPSIARRKLWAKMQDVNARVQDFARENKQLTFIDTAPSLLGPDGEPQKEFFRNDGLHMSEKGYAEWNKLLQLALSDPAVPSQ